MLTFPFASMISPCQLLEHSGNSSILFGQKETLQLVYSIKGNCGIQQDETILFATGTFLVCPYPVHLVPFENCQLVGVSLQGIVVDVYREALLGATVLQGPPCNIAAVQLQQLITLHNNAQWAEASATSYTVLCTLSDCQTDTPPALVSSALALIREQYANVFGVEEIADMLQVSKSHLIRVFSAFTGISPGQYLTNVRIEEAKRVLLHAAIPLEIVANVSGFSSANYFCKVFKKQTGITPAAWRQNNQNQTPASPLADWKTNMLYL